MMGKNGIRVNPAKVAAAKNWPVPTNVKKIQSFLEFVNFNRNFIKGYSKYAESLTRLTKKEEPFIWTEEQDSAFTKLKNACTKQDVLTFFDPAKPNRIETDESDLAIRAYLLQPDDQGRWHPIAYYSRKLSPAEQNYDIADKELLAIIACLEEWHVYVKGAVEIIIYTDHKNLFTFTTIKTLNRKQIRWSELLGRYKFIIRRIAEKDNGRTDALNRRVNYINREPREQTVLRINNDGSLSSIPQNFETILIILQNDKEQYSLSRKKVQIS